MDIISNVPGSSAIRKFRSDPRSEAALECAMLRLRLWVRGNFKAADVQQVCLKLRLSIFRAKDERAKCVDAISPTGVWDNLEAGTNMRNASSRQL
jgi:hypothetical protein